MTDFYSQNRCVCSTRSHGPLLCAFCLSFHFKDVVTPYTHISEVSRYILYTIILTFDGICTIS